MSLFDPQYTNSGDLTPEQKAIMARLAAQDPGANMGLAAGAGGDTPGAPPNLMGIAPAPTPAGLLNIPTGPAAPQGSMIDRIVSRLKHATQGEASPGAEAMLTPEQIDSARPGLLSMMFNGGATHEAFQKNLQDAITGSQQVTMFKHGQHIQSREDAVQAEIAQRFAAPTDHQENTAEMKDRLLSAYAYGSINGANPAWLKEAGDVAKTIVRPEKIVPERAATKMDHVVSDGSLNPAFKGMTVNQLLDPVTHKVVAEVPVGAAPMSEEAKDFRRIGQAIQMQGQTDANERSAASRTMTESAQFEKESNPYTTFQSRYVNFENAMDQAKLGNPGARQTVLLNYMNSEATTPGRGQLGILKYLSDVDPSIKGQMAIAAKRLQSGTFPPYVLDNLEKMIAGKHASFANQYERLRAARVGNNPRLENIIPRTETVFNVSGANGGNTPPPPAPTSRITPMQH